MCVCIYIAAGSALPPPRNNSGCAPGPKHSGRYNTWGTQKINISAQTAVRDPRCLARQTPHLH